MQQVKIYLNCALEHYKFLVKPYKWQKFVENLTNSYILKTIQFPKLFENHTNSQFSKKLKPYKFSKYLETLQIYIKSRI